MKMLTCAALMLAIALPAFAEPHPGRAPATGQGQMMDDARAGMGVMHGMCPMMGMNQRTEGALAFLKTEIKITSAQTAAWDAFAAAYRETKGPGGQMPMMPGGMMGAGKTAQPLPERMAQHAKMMEDRLAHVKKMHGAVTQLYAALGADQKRTADELFPMFMMCRMM